VTATTTTTIRGVSIFSRQRTRPADVFDIALSREGIVIRRPGRVDQHITWDRISEWELAERPGCVVLTLRGGGSVTPLLVKGWTLDDLGTVIREAAAEATGPAADAGAPVPTKAAPPPSIAAPGPVVPVGVPVVSRAAHRRAARRPRRRSVWKPLVVIVLLGVLATAVALVLLQSAGIISWGFLGPTA
jgi:hypothetical protein